MSPLKLGIIGAGHIFWSHHLLNLKKMDSIELVAVCDPSEKSQQRAREELKAKAYGEIPEMLAAEQDLDALLNFSPPKVREAVVQAACERELPLFVEKPAAPSVADAQKILALLKAKPIPVSVGFMWRYLPAVERMREMLAGQTIIHIKSEYFCPALTKWEIAPWFKMKEISGGPILDQGIHLLDLLRYLVGDITEVSSFGTNVLYPLAEDCTIEDSSSTLLRFANGATGAHLQSWVYDTNRGLITVWTPSSVLTLNVDGFLTGKWEGEDFSYHPPENTKNPHHCEVELFFEAVRSGDFSKVRSTYADAAQSLAVAEAINTSMAQGTRQPIPAL